MEEKFIDRKWHFTIVENSVIEDEQLLPSEKLVYIVLSKFASQERCCFPSLSTIVKLSGYSKSTVVRAINRLGHLGYLRKERRKDEVRGNISTFYTLTLPNAPLPEEAPEESTPEEEELLFDSTPCLNDTSPCINETSPCLMMQQPLYHDDTTLVSPVNHNDIYYNDIQLTRDNKYITYVREDSPEAKREIVTHLYHQLKDLGISKSQKTAYGVRKKAKEMEKTMRKFTPS